MDKTEAIREKLKVNSAAASFELQQLEMRKFVLSEMNDALSDMTEEAIHATAILRMADEVLFAEFGGLPQVRAFTTHDMSLMRSRQRLGRIEGCGLSNRPIGHLEPIQQKRDIEDDRQHQAESKREGGFFSRIFRRKH